MGERAMEGPAGTAERVEASLLVPDPMARAVVRAALFGGDVPKIGRYAIVCRIGSGGMGVVYRARDAQLDREVALKMLPDLADPRLHERLPREAKALARLSHPNVVQVYDVGLHAGGFYIAMELVRGVSLRHWQHGRSSEETLAAYREVGRGVAAAHAVGLLHRDLKPENVLIGSDGRARVLDFGLAADDSAARERTIEGAPQRPFSTVSSRMGTPLYMAPEQLAGAPLDARTDIFAFCVALFEALAHAHPFAGRTSAGDIDWTRLPTTTPRHVRSALARGLSIDPNARFTTMDELLKALERPRRGFAFAFVVAGAVVATTLAGIAVMSRPVVQTAGPCDGLALTTSWDDRSAERMAEAFAREQPGFGASLWSAVGGRLTDRAAEWTSTRERLCDGTLPGTAIAIGRECLEDANVRLATVIELFEQGDPIAIQRAARLIDGLPSAAECLALADASEARAPVHDSDLRGLYDRISRLETVNTLGRLAGETEAIDAVIREAEASGDPKAKVHAWLLQAEVLKDGPFDQLEARLSQVYFTATEAGLGRQAALAATYLAHFHGVSLHDFASAQEWVEHAKGAIARFDLGDAAKEHLDRIRAQILLVAGRLDEAEVALRDLLSRLDARDADSPMRARVSADLGELLIARGRGPEAERIIAEAYELATVSLGREHPDLAEYLIGRASAVGMQGRKAEAEAFLLQAAALHEHAHPPDAEVLSVVYANLATTVTPTRPEVALVYARKALRLAESGGSGDIVSTIHHTIGNIASDRGDLDEAQRHFERERALIEADLGAEHPDVGHPLHSLGRLHMTLGELDVAEPMLRRTLELWTKAYGPGHPLVSFPLSTLGELELARGRDAAAVDLLRRALAIRVAKPGNPDKLAQTQFALARALWSDRRARAEARELATAARDAYAAIGEPKAAQLREVEAWSKTHR